MVINWYSYAMIINGVIIKVEVFIGISIFMVIVIVIFMV